MQNNRLDGNRFYVVAIFFMISIKIRKNLSEFSKKLWTFLKECSIIYDGLLKALFFNKN